MRLRASSILLVFPLLAAGCAAGASQPVATPTVTVTATVTATPVPEPEPTLAQPLPLGTPAEFNIATFTVHAVDLNSAPSAPAPETEGDRWASIEVEACNTSNEPLPTDNRPWRLMASDNRMFEPASVGYNQFPQPDYGFGEEALAGGECKRAWITFVVNSDADISAVRFAAGSVDPVRWAVS